MGKFAKYKKQVKRRTSDGLTSRNQDLTTEFSKWYCLRKGDTIYISHEVGKLVRKDWFLHNLLQTNPYLKHPSSMMVLLPSTNPLVTGMSHF